MDFFIASIILLVIAIILLFVARGARLWRDDENRSSEDRNLAKVARPWLFVGAAVVVVVAVVAFLFSVVRIVPETQAAVPVTFGKVGEPMGSGWNWKAPWTEVHTFPTRPITVEVAGEDALYARTQESGQVKVEISGRWGVVREESSDTFRQVRTGDDSKISDQIVEKNLRQAASEVFTTLTNQEAVAGDRGATAAAIKEKMAEQLQGYGIFIEDINIRSVEPDEKTSQVLETLAQENQRELTARKAADTAKAVAEKQLIEAQGQVAAASVLGQITPEQLDAQCLALVQEAIRTNVTLYFNPCGTGGVEGVIVNR